MNKDRGIIKWLPFESLVSNKTVIDSILKEKNKIKKPVLSLEQQQEIEDTLIHAFYEQEKIRVTYYKNGQLYTLYSKIIQLQTSFKKITFENHITLLFSQIISIQL